jgi:integrase
MSTKQPSYRYHKARNCAVVTLDGKDRYLGPYDSPESWEKYHRLIAEWLASQNLPKKRPAEPPPLTLNALILSYWKHVKSYYVKDNHPTSEQDTIRQALRFVCKIYGSTPAIDFSPLKLKAVREAMIQHPITHKVKVVDKNTGVVTYERRVLRIGLSRRFINKQMDRIKRMFAWAVEEEILPVQLHRRLLRVKGLRKNRSDAREKARVKIVEDKQVELTLPHLPAPVRCMVQVQRLCGGRPQDMVVMKPCDIDRAAPVWEYRPGRHKGQHHDRERVVFLGPKAQKLLLPFLDAAGPEEYVFSPVRAETGRLMALRRQRGIPLDRPVKPRGKWSLRDHYDAASYRRAVRRVCKKLGISIWCPLQLRHTAGTAIRKQFGLEASQAVLGHAELGVTQIYSEVDRAAALKVMAEIG